MTYKELAELCLKHAEDSVLIDIQDLSHVVFYNARTGEPVVKLCSDHHWFFNLTESK